MTFEHLVLPSVIFETISESQKALFKVGIKKSVNLIGVFVFASKMVRRISPSTTFFSFLLPKNCEIPLLSLTWFATTFILSTCFFLEACLIRSLFPFVKNE